VANNLTEKDHGYDDLEDAIGDLDGATVTIGIHSEDADPKDDRDINLAGLLSVHEFGTVIEHPNGALITIPPRPVIRGTMSDKEGVLMRLSRKLLEASIDGDLDVDQAMELLGQKAKQLVQQRFGDKTKLEPNAESTIRQKTTSAGVGDAPLVDKAQMKQAIDYQVQNAD